MAGRFAARRGCGRPNLEKPPREWDTGGLSSENQWNPMEECIYGAGEGSEGAQVTEFNQCYSMGRPAEGSTSGYWQLGQEA